MNEGGESVDRGGALERGGALSRGDILWEATVRGRPVTAVVVSGSVCPSVVLNERCVVAERPSSSLGSDELDGLASALGEGSPRVGSSRVPHLALHVDAAMSSRALSMLMTARLILSLIRSACSTSTSSCWPASRVTEPR